MNKIQKSRKGDVNWTIVSLILAVIVLIILVFIFKEQIFKTQSGVETATKCETLYKGECNTKEACESQGKLAIQTGCQDKDRPYCCIEKSYKEDKK